MQESFGSYFAELRKNAGLGLRQFCLEHQIDPGNLSKMERGKLPAPPADRLEFLAHALGLRRGSQEWTRLFDLASVARGEIPQDILGSHRMTTQLLTIFEDLRTQAPRGVA